MFTIDLLKGQGIPMKSRPEGIVIAAVTLAVPLAIAIAIFSFYLRGQIIMSIKKQDIANYEAKIAKMSDVVKLQRLFEREKIVYSSCLSEVKSSIGRHTQWSSILTTLVENIPDSIVLTAISVKQGTIKKSIPQKDDPKKMVDTIVPIRTLHMSVYGSPQYDCGDAVRQFRDRLWSSALLGPKLENIRVSQKSERIENKDVISYEIDCVFKPVSPSPGDADAPAAKSDK
jgi:Tfp pilus assembly protein PilN